MSDSKTEETPKITSQVKTKDPRKVAAVYKLQQLGKAAKERKMWERIENEKADKSMDNTSDGPSYLTLGKVATVAGIAFGAIAVYYAYRSNKANDMERKLLNAELSRVESPKPDKRKPKIVLDSLD